MFPPFFKSSSFFSAILFFFNGLSDFTLSVTVLLICHFFFSFSSATNLSVSATFLEFSFRATLSSLPSLCHAFFSGAASPYVFWVLEFFIPVGPT
jgi:hypothetical protein